MTKKELEQYRSVVAEMDEVRERITENVVSDVVTGSDTHHPYTVHPIKVEGVSDMGAYQRDTALLARLSKKKNRVEDFIHRIEDSQTRRIFRYMYIDGEQKPTWRQVARKIYPKLPKEKLWKMSESLRKKHDRFLEKT